MLRPPTEGLSKTVTEMVTVAECTSNGNGYRGSIFRTAPPLDRIFKVYD